MNITKHVTSRIASRNKTMFGAISNCIKNNMKTSALVLGLMGLPMFSSMADNSDSFRNDNSNTTISRTVSVDANQDTTEIQNPEISFSKNKESLFNEVKDINHQIIGIDLGTKNVVFTKSVDSKFVIVEDVYSQKKCPIIKIASTPENTLESIAKEGESREKRLLKSTADIPSLIKEYRENPDTSRLKPVEGYKYLTQCEVGDGTNIVPIQDVMTEIDINKSYGQQQIFGIMLQAKRHFAKQFSGQDKLSNNGKTVDLNLTLSDNIPEENKEIISAIYAEAYAEEVCGGDLSKINVSWITQSDAALANYLYENSNTLQNIENHGKLVVLDLGQSGLRMKGLNGTDKEIQLTKSKTYENISGDLIDQAIWKVFKDEIVKNSDVDRETLETNISIKSKCLVELNKVKEKLSAQGADAIKVNIDMGDDDVDFVFSVEELNEALKQAGLIETFKDDIKDGVKQMYGKDQDTKDVEFVIVGGSLRIPCLQNALEEKGGLTSIKLNRTINMDEFASYGASSASLLKSEEIKNKLLKKVDVNKVLSKENDVTKLKEIKSELDKLVNAHKNQQECAVLRNEIEGVYYDIQRKMNKKNWKFEDFIHRCVSDLDLTNKIKNIINMADKAADVNDGEKVDSLIQKAKDLIDRPGLLQDGEFMKKLNSILGEEQELANNLVSSLNELNNILEKNKVIKETFKDFSCKVMINRINDLVNKKDKTENDVKALSTVNTILPLFNKLVKTVAEGLTNKGFRNGDYVDGSIEDVMGNVKQVIINITKGRQDNVKSKLQGAFLPLTDSNFNFTELERYVREDWGKTMKELGKAFGLKLELKQNMQQVLENIKENTKELTSQSDFIKKAFLLKGVFRDMNNLVNMAPSSTNDDGINIFSPINKVYDSFSNMIKIVAKHTENNSVKELENFREKEEKVINIVKGLKSFINTIFTTKAETGLKKGIEHAFTSLDDSFGNTDLERAVKDEFLKIKADLLETLQTP